MTAAVEKYNGEYWGDVRQMVKTLTARRLDQTWPPANIEQQIERQVKLYVGRKESAFILDQTDHLPMDEAIDSRIELTNPFVKEGYAELTNDKRNRYAAFIAMENDVKELVERTITKKSIVKCWRLIDTERNCPLTHLELNPDCEESQNDVPVDYFDEEAAHEARHVYEQQMALLGLEPVINVIGYNEDNEAIVF